MHNNDRTRIRRGTARSAVGWCAAGAPAWRVVGAFVMVAALLATTVVAAEETATRSSQSLTGQLWSLLRPGSSPSADGVPAPVAADAPTLNIQQPGFITPPGAPAESVSKGEVILANSQTTIAPAEGPAARVYRPPADPSSDLTPLVRQVFGVDFTPDDVARIEEPSGETVVVADLQQPESIGSDGVLPAEHVTVSDSRPAQRPAAVGARGRQSPWAIWRAQTAHLWRQVATVRNIRPAGGRSGDVPVGMIRPESAVNPLSDAAGAVVGTDQQEGALAALWRTATMRQNEPWSAAGQPGGTAVASSVPFDRRLEESVFLQPFYMVDSGRMEAGRGESGPGSPASLAGRRSRSNDENARQATALIRQLSMTRTENWRVAGDDMADSLLLPELAAWEEDWLSLVPSIVNPFTVTHDAGPPPGLVGETRLVAFQQDDVPGAPDLDLDEEASDEMGDPEGQAEAPEGLAEAERVGEEPEDTSLEFLRTVTVLLEPGESQLDVGVEYLLSENEFPILLSDGVQFVGVENARFRVRELSVPIQYRFGLLKRVQVFVGAPVGWANTQVSISSFERHNNAGGLGDINFGATIQLVEGNAEKSHMIATIAATAPTGGDPFVGASTLAPSAPSLGQGFWSISGNVLCIQQYDPVVFFYGVGTEHYFARDYLGLEIEPGAVWDYTFGVGFAVNSRVTLSTRFRGAYVQELRVNRERLLGTNVEPMSMRFSATISKPHGRLVEPFVDFGITDAAVSSVFGVTWTF